MAATVVGAIFRSGMVTFGVHSSPPLRDDHNA